MIVFWAEGELGMDVTEVDATQWIQGCFGRPILTLQGGLDDHISVDSGEKLYQAACEPKELWYEAEAGHANLDEFKPQEYEDRLVAFYDQHLLGE